MRSLSDIQASGFSGDVSAFRAGDITGPSSATDNSVPRFDLTTGKLLQGSKAIVTDDGSLFIGTAPSAYFGYQRIFLGGAVDGKAGAFGLCDVTGNNLAGLGVSYFAPDGLGGSMYLASSGDKGILQVDSYDNASRIGSYSVPLSFGIIGENDLGTFTVAGKFMLGGGAPIHKVGSNIIVGPRSVSQKAASGAWTSGTYSYDGSSYSGPGPVAGSYAGDVTASALVSGSTGARVLGLSVNPAASTAVPSGVDYGIHANTGSASQAIAGGAFTAVFGSTVALGDVLVIRRVGTTIEYLHNGTLFHTATGVSAASALRLDMAFDAVGAELSEIFFGPTSTVAVQVHGIVQATAFRFADGSTQNTASTGGGGGSGDVTGPASATDNAIMRADGSTGKAIQSSGASVTDAGKVISTGLETKSPAALATLVNDAGCTVTANSITATGSGWGNVAAHSVESYAGDVSLSATVAGGTLGNSMLALNSDPATDNHYTSLDYATNISGSGNLWAFESPVNASSAFTVALGDVLTIRRVGTSIEYLKNGSIFHTTTGVSASTPLYLDTAFDATGAAFTEITFGPTGLAPIKADGLIESTAGGVKFPDATTQITAAFGGRGVTTVNFGAFPGKSDASTAITGQTGIASWSRVRVWLEATATVDHSADEHWLENIGVIAGNIVPGTGFTIYAKNTGTLNEPVGEQWANTRNAGPGTGTNQVRPDLGGGKGTRLYGQYTVAWEWI